jgi:hypothetical protein
VLDAGHSDAISVWLKLSPVTFAGSWQVPLLIFFCFKDALGCARFGRDFRKFCAEATETNVM